MTPNKEKALGALLTCRTRAEAAREAGIGESTLREYMKDPEFLRRYQEAFGNLVQDAARQAQQTISPALSTAKEIMLDHAEQSPARLQAARLVLEYALKLTEQADILERISALEQREVTER